MTGGTLDHSTPRRRRRQARRAARQAARTHRHTPHPRRRPRRQSRPGSTAKIKIASTPPPAAADTTCQHDRPGRSTTYLVIHPSGTATVCADCHTVISTATHPTILTPPPNNPQRRPRPPEPPG